MRRTTEERKGRTVALAAPKVELNRVPPDVQLVDDKCLLSCWTPPQIEILNDAKIDIDPIDKTSRIPFLEGVGARQARTHLVVVQEPDIINFDMRVLWSTLLATYGKSSLPRFLLHYVLKSTPSSFTHSLKDPNWLSRRTTWTYLFLLSNRQWKRKVSAGWLARAILSGFLSMSQKSTKKLALIEASDSKLVYRREPADWK